MVRAADTSSPARRSCAPRSPTLRRRAREDHRDPERHRPLGPAAGRRPARLRAKFAGRTRSSCCWSAPGLREGLPPGARRPAGLIRRVGKVRFLIAGSGTAEAELKEQAARLGLMGTARSSAGPATTTCIALPDRRPLSGASIYEPSGWWRWRRWPPVPTIVADTGGLREVVPRGAASDCASAPAPLPGPHGREPADRRRPARRASWPRPPSTCCASTGQGGEGDRRGLRALGHRTPPPRDDRVEGRNAASRKGTAHRGFRPSTRRLEPRP